MRSGGPLNRSDPSISTEFIQTPLSWYRHITRPYRGKDRPYAEAVQILSFVTSKYITGNFPGRVLLSPSPMLCQLFGMTEDMEQLAVRHLVNGRYLSRLVIRGYIPWDPRIKGTWRFLIPRFDRLIGITYR